MTEDTAQLRKTLAGKPPAACAPRLIHVMYLVSTLHYGGAERQTVELARRLDRSRFSPMLCSLDERVALTEGIEDVRVFVLQKRSKYDVSLIPKARRLLIEQQIDILHCFLFDAEMLGRLAGRWARVPVVVASERNSAYGPRAKKERLLKLTRPCFDIMIANSHAGKKYNVQRLGVPANRIHVVDNGVDADRFRPHDVSELWKRVEVPNDGPVVGMFASFKPQKNHEMYVKVAVEVLKKLPGARFLFVAQNVPGTPETVPQRGAILEAVRAAGIEERCHFLMDRHDVEDLYCLCDLTVLTSVREGTPNVLLESMASGVPVVATDVADNARIVPEGRVGHIVKLDDVAAMTERVVTLLTDAERLRVMGVSARRHAESEFSLDGLARNTEAVYVDALRRYGGRRGRKLVRMSNRE